MYQTEIYVKKTEPKLFKNQLLAAGKKFKKNNKKDWKSIKRQIHTELHCNNFKLANRIRQHLPLTIKTYARLVASSCIHVSFELENQTKIVNKAVKLERENELI